MWSAFSTGLTEDFVDAPNLHAVGRLIVRLLIAAVLGGLLGYDRERRGKKAGFRTHMLVSLGAAMFVSAMELLGGSNADISRVIQGVVVGIGFLGAGSIVKHQDTDEIQGLTTAASIWFTSAVGLAAGSGRLAAALVGTLLALIILMALAPLERWMHSKSQEARKAATNQRTPQASGDSQ
jgi:putative Mg2+ transporter-C (MgtC) family protein